MNTPSDSMNSNPQTHQPAAEDNRPASDAMLTKKELAAQLKVAERTVERWQRRGVLPYVKVRKVVRFHWPDVVEFLKGNFMVRRSR